MTTPREPDVPGAAADHGFSRLRLQALVWRQTCRIGSRLAADAELRLGVMLQGAPPKTLRNTPRDRGLYGCVKDVAACEDVENVVGSADVWVSVGGAVFVPTEQVA